MSEIVIHLDQQDHKDINLGQEDTQEFDLNNVHIVYGGLDFETQETQSGIVKYNSKTKKYSTVMPDSEVSAGSENLVTSDAVKKYVDEFGGAIDTISIDGEVQQIDKNKNVDLKGLAKKADIPSLDGLATEAYVDAKVADLVNSAPETLDTLGELATAFKDNKDVVDALDEAVSSKASQTDLDIANNNIANLTEQANDFKTRIEELEENSGSGGVSEDYVKNYVDTAISTSITSVLNTEV